MVGCHFPYCGRWNTVGNVLPPLKGHRHCCFGLVLDRLLWLMWTVYEQEKEKAKQNTHTYNDIHVYTKVPF